MNNEIRGNIIEEIKNLPEKELHRFIIEKAEHNLKDGMITTE